MCARRASDAQASKKQNFESAELLTIIFAPDVSECNFTLRNARNRRSERDDWRAIGSKLLNDCFGKARTRDECEKVA